MTVIVRKTKNLLNVNWIPHWFRRDESQNLGIQFFLFYFQRRDCRVDQEWIPSKSFLPLIELHELLKWKAQIHTFNCYQSWEKIIKETIVPRLEPNTLDWKVNERSRPSEIRLWIIVGCFSSIICNARCAFSLKAILRSVSRAMRCGTHYKNELLFQNLLNSFSNKHLSTKDLRLNNNLNWVNKTSSNNLMYQIQSMKSNINISIKHMLQNRF